MRIYFFKKIINPFNFYLLFILFYFCLFEMFENNICILYNSSMMKKSEAFLKPPGFSKDELNEKM